MINWQTILGRLRACPENTYRVLPPCPQERIDEVQSELGLMPRSLVDMLKSFNGARLFVDALPLVSIFGISTTPSMSPLMWAPDWYIDKFTPSWRASHGGSDDWAIAMMNYGGLILLDSDEVVTEWDTSENQFTPRRQTLEQWIDEVMREGETLLQSLA